MQDTLHRRRIVLELAVLTVGAIALFLVALPWWRERSGLTSIWQVYTVWRARDMLSLAAFLSLALALFALDRWREAARDRARLLTAERARQENAAHYQLLFDHARDALIVEDESERIVDANPAACALFGYSRAELLSMTTPDLQPLPEQVPSFPIYAHPDEYPDLGTITQGKRRDGSIVPLEISMTAYQAGGRKLFLSIVRDISERRQAEEALRAERDRSQRYLDVAGVILLVLGADGCVSLINKKGAEVLGSSESEIIGKNWFDAFVPPRLRDRVQLVVRDLLEDGSPNASYNENAILTADGRERLIAWRNVVLRDDAGRGVGTLSSGEDITEQRKLEEQLRQAHKMEAIGQLAGGVAHEFNNLLQVINGYSEFALEAIAAADPNSDVLALRDDVVEVRKAGERAADLTRQLLAFSRRQERHPRILELREILDGMAKMLRPLIGEDVTLRMEVADDLGCIRADVAQFTQAVINLAVNARDAIRASGSAGSITVKAANAGLDEAAALRLGLHAGEYVRVDVVDTGIGMSPHVMQHLFEPFFTTKRVGEGTGLGLSAVYGIVKQSGGGIGVESAPGKGSTFGLYLPRVRSRQGSAERQRRQAALDRGHEVVLVVEDDEGVRELTGRLLSSLGYQVVAVASAEEALGLPETQPGDAGGVRHIDLVLADVLLPNLKGPDMVAELQRRGCTCHVLYMSGHAPETLGAELLRAVPLLKKPFTLPQLARRVRRTLDTALDRTPPDPKTAPDGSEAPL